MRHDLKVPFADKEAAKKLGARWDAARKIWYVADKADLTPFSKWSPTPHDPSGAEATRQKSTPARTQATGRVYVGSDYIEQPRVCQCLPWDSCEKCRLA